MCIFSQHFGGCGCTNGPKTIHSTCSRSRRGVCRHATVIPVVTADTICEGCQERLDASLDDLALSSSSVVVSSEEEQAVALRGPPSLTSSSGSYSSVDDDEGHGSHPSNSYACYPEIKAELLRRYHLGKRVQEDRGYDWARPSNPPSTARRPLEDWAETTVTQYRFEGFARPRAAGR